MPPESKRVGGGESSYYDDSDPHNTVNVVDDIVDHWLAYQESFRIGTIIDVVKKADTYYAIIEVTDESAKEAFKNNDVPLFVSPAIAQLDPNEDPENITLWTGIHLAIVSNPAYTIQKALVTSQCHGEGARCLLQLRQASTQNKKSFCCGFCRHKALVRYASIVENYDNNNNNSLLSENYEQFISSSRKFSNSHSNISNNMSTTTATELESNNNNNNNNKVEEENNKNNILNKAPPKAEAGNPPTAGDHHRPRINPETGQPFAGSVIDPLTADTLGIKVAGMEECVQIFTQNGVSPDQSVQICKLAAKALMDNQNQNQQNPTGGGSRPSPGISGQFGSISDYEKEIAKQEVKIGQLMDELKTYKKGDKTDAQRIAELEDTVSTLHRTIKEKEIEAYLVTKIADEELRSKKIKRFADLNMTIEDLKDIYDNSPDPKVVPKKQVASVNNNNEVPNPIGKVKLQVASANNEEKSVTNEIRERNNRISSLLLKRGLQ